MLQLLFIHLCIIFSTKGQDSANGANALNLGDTFMGGLGKVTVITQHLRNR